MKTAHLLLVAAVTGTLILGCSQEKAAQDAEVKVLCGSSMAEPVAKLAEAFEAETGIKAVLTLGGCETLFPQLELGTPADVFVGHAPFAEMLAEKDLRQDALVILGEIGPAIVVPKGNPKSIRALKDLTRDDVRVGLPDARYSTCGEIFEKAAAAAQLLDGIHARTVYTARTHQELATALRTGSVDVVVVWNFIAAMHKDRFEIAPVAARFDSASVFACQVKKPQAPEASGRFFEFLNTELAQQTFSDMGYGVAAASAAEPIVLRMYCAAGVQKPLDELAALFTARNPGIQFETVYQGSGTLLAQIALKEEGDLYIAGDEVYMERAREKGLLKRSERVAVFTPVLAVPKANPKAIASFTDLTKDGVRLGLGDEQAAAVGKVAVELLARKGVWPATQKNVVVTTGTVNELAIQVSVGSLDAAIIWDATARQFADRVSIVAEGDGASQVGVPIGILTFTRHAQEAEAFLALATSAEAAPIFEKYGFSVPGGGS
ncbi:MAG: molybdate ABC transporter substrate-binding protein [Nitrospiraceae bacterium]|nr:molybdate ABC transporter substrate-binding protein [Nitrospiraceae bacterium]